VDDEVVKVIGTVVVSVMVLCVSYLRYLFIRVLHRTDILTDSC